MTEARRPILAEVLAGALAERALGEVLGQAAVPVARALPGRLVDVPGVLHVEAVAGRADRVARAAGEAVGCERRPQVVVLESGAHLGGDRRSAVFELLRAPLKRRDVHRGCLLELGVGRRVEGAELEQRLAALGQRLQHVAAVDRREEGVVSLGLHVRADRGEERPFRDVLDVGGDDRGGLAMGHVVDVVVALREEQVGLVDRLDVVEVDAEEDLLGRLQRRLEPGSVKAEQVLPGGKKSFFGGRMVTS